MNVEVAKPKTHVEKKPETSSDNESALPRARKSVSQSNSHDFTIMITHFMSIY